MMKQIRANNYKMEKIADKMSKKFGKIKKGEEANYSLELFTMESNLLKIHRKYPKYNSRKVIEAINILLLKINGYLNDIEYDFSGQLDDANKAYLEALQTCCDPFFNEELKAVLGEDFDLTDKKTLEEFFATRVMCLIRIKESAELWNKEWGRDGYFKFLENHMGDMIESDELNFTVRVDPDKVDIDLEL